MIWRKCPPKILWSVGSCETNCLWLVANIKRLYISHARTMYKLLMNLSQMILMYTYMPKFWSTMTNKNHMIFSRRDCNLERNSNELYVKSWIQCNNFHERIFRRIGHQWISSSLRFLSLVTTIVVMHLQRYYTAHVIMNFQSCEYFPSNGRWIKSVESE